MSSSTMRGCSRSITASADAPSPASPTTSKPSVSSSVLADNRKPAWSSTITTVGLTSRSSHAAGFLASGLTLGSHRGSAIPGASVTARHGRTNGKRQNDLSVPHQRPSLQTRSARIRRECVRWRRASVTWCDLPAARRHRLASVPDVCWSPSQPVSVVSSRAFPGTISRSAWPDPMRSRCRPTCASGAAGTRAGRR